MRKTLIIAGALCIVVGVGLFVALMTVPWGWGSGRVLVDVSDNIDRHFMEQMIPHHEDAVAMAELALTRAQHPELRQLAETIRTDQSREIEQMRAWYRSWYGVEAPESGTGPVRGRGMMGMGMMGDIDLRVLEAAQQFDREFIEQMIPHHQMAVMMARMVLSSTERKEIRGLARSIIETQNAEIRQMRDWYRDWYGGA